MVDVQIALDHGVPLHAVADAVRRHVVSHLAEQTGLITTEVDVAVVDIRQLPAPGQVAGPLDAGGDPGGSGQSRMAT
ncbi:Asp23/Gls24 family envelope stress response protein [Geodermatophilus sp. SYSU D00079]